MRLTALLILVLLFPASMAVSAPSKHGQNLEREAARLDRTAASQTGEQAVVARLNRDFPAAGSRITDLRSRGLGYGEIAILLACAKTLPGGATPENIDQVAMLRQGPPVLGWDAIGKRLGIKLGMCVSQVKKVNDESRREMKKNRPSQQMQAAPRPVRRSFEGEGKSLPQGDAAQ